MHFKAIQTLILWHDSQMKVFNPGDKGDLPEDIIKPYIEGKQAEAAKGKAAKPKDSAPEEKGDAADEGEGATGDKAAEGEGGEGAADADAPPV